MESKPKLAPYYMLSVSLIGIADAFYLAHASYTGSSLSCAIFEGCNTVAKSPYSHVFGTPLSYFGLIFYLYMFAVAALLAYDPNSRGLRVGALLYTVVGVCYSAYFLYLQLGVIHAVCIYCLISTVTTVALLGLAIWHFRSTRSLAQNS